MGAAQARSRIKNRGSRRAVLPTEVRAMNENVKIDYDTAEKVMDLDGCRLRHTAAPATPDAQPQPAKPVSRLDAAAEAKKRCSAK